MIPDKSSSSESIRDSYSDSTIDCILFVSFGGPDGPDDVIPFLENVLRGKPVPKARMLEVAEHYYHFGGVSPINAQNRDIMHRLKAELDRADIQLPIYWGNRNWKPGILDALKEIQAAGHRRALPIFTNMFSSYSGCRQYRENIDQAVRELGPGAPRIAPRLRFGFNHPRFIAAQVDLIRGVMDTIPAARREKARLLFCAHSIPNTMANNCKYEVQLRESARLVARELSWDPWELVYQSRSGPPQQPWLEPDVCDRIRELPGEGIDTVLIVPLGFVSDHLEVMYDLDTEARQLCSTLQVDYYRAPAVGIHHEFIMMLVDLIGERLSGTSQRSSMGDLPPLHDRCPDDCCLYGLTGKGIHDQTISKEVKDRPKPSSAQ